MEKMFEKMKTKNLVPGIRSLVAQAPRLRWMLLLLAGLLPPVAQAQYTFEAPQVISGDWGNVINDNTGVTAETGAPSNAGSPANAPLYYQWTAPSDGVVTLDTVIDASTGDLQLDTVLGVYTGSSLANLNQVAANDDLFPINDSGDVTQINETGKGNGRGLTAYVAPFYGPSALRFNAKSGQTYYFVVDTKITSGTGPIQLNWAYKSSGVFRFASENVDFYSGMLLYQAAATESLPLPGDEPAESAEFTYYRYNAPGLLVTVTRVAGSTGRATVGYTTVDGDNLTLMGPSDTPGYAGIDYIPVSGTLVFDDYEMSKTILIPMIYNGPVAGDQSNRVFSVQLVDDGGVTSPLLDPNESADVSSPRVDSTFGTAMIRSLNPDADPYGPDVLTNGMAAEFPTNSIINFPKTNYRVPGDVNDPTTSPWQQVTIYLERFGTNQAAQSVDYIVNGFLGTEEDPELDIYFPLQPGSDYAVPTPATQSPIRGTNSDFNMVAGTVSFGQGAATAAITFTVPTSTLTKFNKDFLITIDQVVNNATFVLGEINQATVTILFNDLNPPAGSVDEFHNADFNSHLAIYANNIPITSPPDEPNPGVGLYGEVYAMTILTNGEALLGGDFSSYNDSAQSCVALVQTNGQLDTTFNIGSGADAAVNVVGQYNGQFYIGGSFSSFNGTQVGSIARLNANGSLDSTFNPGLGADGIVRALAIMTNGEVMIGGEFTHVNGSPARHLALLKTDGTLDTSFNPSNNISGTVYALALYTNSAGQQQIIVGGNFTVAGKSYANIARLNLNGSIDSTFNPGTGPDNTVHAVAAQVEGQILLAGEFANVNGTAMSRIARLNASGVLDTTNFFIGTGADAPVFCIYPMTVTNGANVVTGGIYVGGSFANINGTHRLGFARLYPNGTVDTTFMDTAYNQFAGLKRIFSYDAPAVLATAIQGDGNVLIGGSFNQVGGGQALADVCDTLDDETFITESFNDPNLWIEPKTRDGVRNRSGFARLIGGATPGPGNFGLSQNSYSVNKSQSYLSVSLLRTNGMLGPVAANFSVQPGLALSGSDYSYDAAPPICWVDSQYLVHPSRERSDGLFGLNGFLMDPYGLSLSQVTRDVAVNKQSTVTVSVIPDKANPGNLNATFQMANPSGQDTFYLGGENIPVCSALGASSVPLTLVDDTSYPGTFGFSSPTYVATNLSASISVVRSNGVYGVVTMKYSATNGTASSPGDYLGITNLTMTFAQNQTTNGFNVTIKNDGSVTNVEKTVNLHLGSLGTTPGATFGISNAVLRIINPNFQGYLTLAATNFSGNLSSGFVSFVVNRTVGSYGTLTVQWATTNGTATNGIDYVGATNTLTWNSGDVSPRTVSVPLLNPGTIGGTKQFGVSLFNPTDNSASTPALLAGEITNASLTITNDNNPGTLQLSATNYIVNENGGYATISVFRAGGAVGSISAAYTTTNGTAFAGTNYVATSGTITLASGQTATNFTVQILNDGVVDPPPASFYFNVILNSSGSPTNATVEIVDAQTYNWPAGSPDTLFNTNGMNSDVLSIVLQTNGQIVAAGTFTSVGTTPENYIARLNTDGTLDTGFLNNLSGANAPVNSLDIQGDGRIFVAGAFTTLDGVRRNFIGRLMPDGSLDTSFNPGSGADNTVNTVVETFINGLRRVYIGGAFGSVNGSSSPGLARLEADYADDKNDGSVDPSFSVGSGADGQVYAIAVYPTNSIYAGKLLVGGSFNHFNGFAATNLVRLNIDGSVDTNYLAGLGSGPNGTVRALAIQLNGQVLAGGGFTSFNGTSINHICRLNVDGTLDAGFLAAVGPGADNNVNVIAIQPDNRILLGGSFGHVNGVTRNRITRLMPTGGVDPTINFGSGANGDVDAIVVQPADDNLVIGGGFTIYDGQVDSGIARIYGGSQTGSGAFSFSTANFYANEGSSAPITIVRSGGTSGTNADFSGNISVQFTATTNGSAAAGVNFGPVTQTVVFPAGEVQEIVQVPTYDDHVITSNLTVSLSLTNETPPATNGIQPVATLWVVNIDAAIAFSQSFYTVAKNDATGNAVIDVLRLGGTNDTATVNFYTPTNGSAIPGVDFYPTNTILTFQPGQSDVQVDVPIISNTNVEGNRIVNLVLTNAANTTGQIPLYSPSNAVLTIIDTVAAPGQLFFTSPTYTATENQGFAYLPVLRINGSSGTVTVNYSLVTSNNVAGWAQPNVDYVNPPGSGGTVTFTPGLTSNSVPIQLKINPQPQPPLMLGVTLSVPAGDTTGVTLTSPSSTLLTILNTNAVVSFVNATNYAPETQQFVNVAVQRLNQTNLVSSVQYATFDGTGPGAAYAGINYSNTHGTLTFNIGEVSKSVLVPLITQSNITDLSFGMNLFSPVNAYTTAPSNTVIVVQGAAAGLSFTTNTETVLKKAGSITVPVVCSNPRVEPPVYTTNDIPLEVSYLTVDGTARSGLNYGAVSGTLVFTNGIVTNYITVPILNNTSVSSNLTFSLLLTNVTAPGRIAPFGVETNIIQESNAGLSFSQPNYSVFKNGVTATITVLRTGYTSNTVSVNYLVTNGTAIGGQNFYPTNGTLLFTNGVTSQTFAVGLIASTQVQPNLYALMELLNPTNCDIVSPGDATLTILENGGSYVVPAGAQVISNYTSPLGNGIIGSNDTMTVLFAFRDAAGLNVTNLVAYLLATNNVTAPSPASQAYGPLTVYGHSVSEPFTFTAHGTNTLTISPTFQLYDNTKYIGPATFVFTVGSWTTVFGNSNAIILKDGAAASPYPSIINVSGVGNTLVKATVTLTNLSHQNFSDIDALVVSPTTNTLIMGHVGGPRMVHNVTLIFDDGAASSLPQNGAIATGTNKPTQYGSIPNFP
jgi:uncharacterized delta-60 repeat protein